jgi:hypothetical protein
MVMTCTIVGYQYATEARQRCWVRSAPSATSVARWPTSGPRARALEFGGEGSAILDPVHRHPRFDHLRAHAAEALAELLTEHLGAQTSIVFRHEGVLDIHRRRDHGLWGAPLTLDHARSVCPQAPTSPRRCRPCARRFARGWPEIHIGVGTTRRLRRRQLRPAERFSYTAISDHVNLALLEGLNMSTAPHPRPEHTRGHRRRVRAARSTASR